jgi:hypothetical protein
MQGRKISKLIIVMAFNCRLGKCMSLKECYPYFKIFELPLRDTWVMGLYDTCSYQSPEGRQVSTAANTLLSMNLKNKAINIPLLFLLIFVEPSINTLVKLKCHHYKIVNIHGAQRQ